MEISTKTVSTPSGKTVNINPRYLEVWENFLAVASQPVNYGKPGTKYETTAEQ